MLSYHLSLADSLFWRKARINKRIDDILLKMEGCGKNELINFEDNLDSEIYKYYLMIRILNDQIDGAQFCNICQVYKLPRMHHCSHCNVCVLGYDHHCDFTMACIGLRNHHIFIWFLWSIGVGLGSFVLLALRYLLFQRDTYVGMILILIMLLGTIPAGYFWQGMA